MNIHNPDAKVKGTIQALKEDPSFPEANKILIKEMIGQVLAEGNSKVRALKYMQYLKGVSRILQSN